MNKSSIKNKIIDVNPINESNVHIDVLKLSDTITRISITGRKITQLPNDLNFLKSFQILRIDKTQITKIPVTIGNLTDLTFLSSSKNQLTTLPDSIGNLTNLRELNLTNNQLKTLPDSIGNLKNLQTLEVSNNKLKTLPDSIGKLTKLVLLTIEKNQLKTLPDSMVDMRRLIKLQLFHNPIKQLHKEFLRFLPKNNKGYYIKKDNKNVYEISNYKLKIVTSKLINKNYFKNLDNNLKRKILENTMTLMKKNNYTYFV